MVMPRVILKAHLHLLQMFTQDYCDHLIRHNCIHRDLIVNYIETLSFSLVPPSGILFPHTLKMLPLFKTLSLFTYVG